MELPNAASNSQEAMLRAEEALDRARERGRDGYAVYEPSPQRETGRLRQMSIAGERSSGSAEAKTGSRWPISRLIGAGSRRASHL